MISAGRKPTATTATTRATVHGRPERETPGFCLRSCAATVGKKVAEERQEHVDTTGTGRRQTLLSRLPAPIASPQVSRNRSGTQVRIIRVVGPG